MSKHTALGLAGATAFGGACFLFYVFSKKPPPQSSFPSEQERKAIFDKNAVTWDGGIGLDEAVRQWRKSQNGKNVNMEKCENGEKVKMEKL
ncbi:methyltransferase domain-containing protein [Toxoplasma gondii VEG]|uniref:Methyltransferase domain-containing protein n=1 Tax=Toxoplasma gondii (strain ATCC 50861 / VEG) TaxID=432359 RepID=V5BJU0_TOXGV|nr:methyltransferase domain-containing protein [Toxoplasma gondii VEG]